MIYFDTNCLIFYGFCPWMPCFTQLLYAMEHRTKILDDDNDIDIIYLDFHKVFDRVPYQSLLSK